MLLLYFYFMVYISTFTKTDCNWDGAWSLLRACQCIVNLSPVSAISTLLVWLYFPYINSHAQDSCIYLVHVGDWIDVTRKLSGLEILNVSVSKDAGGSWRLESICRLVATVTRTSKPGMLWACTAATTQTRSGWWWWWWWCWRWWCWWWWWQSLYRTAPFLSVLLVFIQFHRYHVGLLTCQQFATQL